MQNAIITHLVPLVKDLLTGIPALFVSSSPARCGIIARLQELSRPSTQAVAVPRIRQSCRVEGGHQWPIAGDLGCLRQTVSLGRAEAEDWGYTCRTGRRWRPTTLSNSCELLYNRQRDRQAHFLASRRSSSYTCENGHPISASANADCLPGGSADRRGRTVTGGLNE